MFRKLLKHFSIWLFFGIYSFIADPPQGSIIIQVTETSLIIISYMVIYYTELFFFFPKANGSKWKLAAYLSLAFSIFLVFDFLIFKVFLEAFTTIHYFSDIPLDKLLMSEFFLFGIISTMAWGNYQNKLGIEKIKMKGKKEKALLIKELGFLKNQFNSHITFNFLNYCYSRIHKDSAETAESIEIFSRMLRYSLGNKENEMVQLRNEIEYIEDFIKLQRLLSTEVNLHFSTKNEDGDSIYILPRILITLVENAFKHGNVHSTENPIKIEINSSPKYLNLKVTNEKNKHKISEPSGIGHYNLKQQLELLYKNRYTLKIEDKNNIYSSELKLILN